MVRRVPRPHATKDIEKKVDLTELSQDAKKKISIQFLIFLCFELSACPLILNYNKVYFASSLIARPILDGKNKDRRFKKRYLQMTIWLFKKDFFIISS